MSTTDNPAHVLHVSECLHDLKLGDHIEIQWRRNISFGVLAPEVLDGNYDDMVACQMILDKMGLKGYQVHLEAGEDIILTASYQATIQGFEAKSFSREESETFLRKSVEIACEAQTVYYERCAHNASGSNKDAWWYGAVGHLETCDLNEDHCHCQNSGSLLSQTLCGRICSYRL